MLLMETIGFDSLKNDEGQSKLPIKEGRAALPPRQVPSHSQLQTTIYLEFRQQCNDKGCIASYHTHNGSSKHLELEISRFRAQL